MDTDKKNGSGLRLLLSSVCIGAPSVALFFLLFSPFGGCDRKPGGGGSGGPAGGGVVVLYTSVDEPVARPVLEEFTRRTQRASIVVAPNRLTRKGAPTSFEFDRLNGALLCVFIVKNPKNCRAATRQ